MSAKTGRRVICQRKKTCADAPDPSFEERGHRRLTIDPAAENAGAIRAYERVGFREVGIMRKYERDPEALWRDGLLMDMLEEEFNPTSRKPP